ncbi:NTP transferase domain-containing protein [Luteolibacter sp. AS25]|uniref:NTP transferase domain-containing protein n=1 Tax=Luteolibacter sp. AS25 TaxID=3135776 RepID=UPI00398B0DAF
MKGLVLAGGKGIRMGREKAGIIHRDGRTFLDRTIELLNEAGCTEVLVSLRQGQEVSRDLEHTNIVRDSGEGPLCGIIAGLETDADSDWVVVACDLPELDLETLVQLKRVEGIFGAYRSEFDGGLEPLCAFYGRGALGLLKKYKESGDWSLRKIMEENGVEVLDLKNKEALTNVNFPEDLGMQPTVEKMWISQGHDFRGRHGLGRERHAIVPVETVECVAGKGLKGDRYFEFKEDFKGQITFFSSEVLDDLRAKYGEICSSVLRRNIVISGLDLEALVGKEFSVQGVRFQGSEECKPCYWMDDAVGTGAEDFLKGRCRGGLRARILTDGALKLGS